MGDGRPQAEALDGARLWHALEEAAANAGIGLVVTVDEGAAGLKAVFVNDVVLRLVGRSRDEFLSRPLLANVPHEDLPYLERLRASRFRREAPERRIETRLVAKGGRLVPVEVGIGRIEWDDLPATVAMVRDLSEGREQETRLVNLETIYNATIDGLLFVDRDMNLVSANRRFAELFGLTQEEILTRPKEEVRAKARECYRDPKVFDEGLRVYDPANWTREFDWDVELVGDRPRFVHEHAAPIFDASGEYVGRVWTYRDVTRERELAGELARHAASLETEVDRRSRKLAETAKMAALGQLVAGVAHEINNPLAFVTSNTEIIHEAWRDALANPDVRAVIDGDASRAHAALEWLHASGTGAFLRRDVLNLVEMNLKGLGRIGEIVRHLRTFAAPRGARKEPTDLNVLLTGVALIFRAQFGGRITLDETLGDLPLVPLDAGKVAQVATNLLVNAAQAIDGKGTVAISTRREGSRAVLEVRDTGNGIHPDDLPKIFEPFFTTKESVGMGLGLSITYAIVMEHGGEITVDSKPGRGTTFSVHLPLEEAGLSP